MYYKEEWINGKLYWKGTPEGSWVEMTSQQYADKLYEATKLRPTNDELLDKIQRLEAQIKQANDYIGSLTH